LPAFFADRHGGRVVIDGGDARHLVRSLRARVGEHIDVIDPAGFLLDVKLDVVTSARVEGKVVDQRAHDPEPRAHVTIAVANLPAPALELVLSRGTEAGAFAFKVFQAERSVARGARPARWQAICREAAMLATRLRVPDVENLPSLQAVLEASVHPVMLDRAASVRLANLTSPVDLTLVVGPEGGWSERELELARIHASLGPRNLRADTAALAGLAVALAARE
jgi:16S rRNA (uracil1498-N3)-methyltransferase